MAKNVKMVNFKMVRAQNGQNLKMVTLGQGSTMGGMGLYKEEDIPHISHFQSFFFFILKI